MIGNPTGPVHGEAVSFTATVSSFAATASGVVPTGTIQFSVDGNPVGDLVTLDGTATAVSAPISTLSTGSHTVTALFSGDVNYTTATSGDLSLNVGQASTSTTVTPSVNPSVFGQPVTFTANVAAVAPGVGCPDRNRAVLPERHPVGWAGHAGQRCGDQPGWGARIHRCQQHGAGDVLG